MKTRILHLFFLLFICTTVFSQEMRVVSGIIKDNEGEPIVGVNVVLKGTNTGTLTNFDGYYEIIAPIGSTLQFLYVGMKTSEMKVTASNSKPAPNQTAAIQPIPKIEAVEEETPQEKPDLAEIIPSREDQSLSPYFIVKSDSPDEAWMPLSKTDVAVSIAGVIADVCVKQIYINESKNTLEAVYVFPGSTRAAVYAMAMTVGDRRTEAKIKKKEQARKEYEQAKEEGKSTTLLEQHRPNVFQMNVANILPGDTIVVEMRYTELLEHESGLYEFVYPTVVGPRYTETNEEWVKRSTSMFESGKTPQFTIQTIIQAGMPIQKVSSVSHNLTIESKTPDQAIISLSNPKDNEGNRDYILQYELQGGKVESGLLRYEHGDENFFLLMVQPPKKPTLDQIPPREYVFIVDVSGSMHGFPLSVSKELIRNLVSALRPTDRFNVMLFESSNDMLYKESVAATEDNIQQALAVIDRQKGGGGTRLYPAVVKAMNFQETVGFSRTFIIVTDGFVTVEQEAFNYIRNHLNDANLFPFGIGTSVNRYMIEGLAHAGMGTPYIVTNHTQAETIGKKAMQEIAEPVLTRISIDWGDFDVYDVEPVAIPDVFAERPMLIYGKYKGAAKGTVLVSGITGDVMYAQKFDVSKARKEHNQALRYLWARNQIRYYDDYAQYYEGYTNGWNDNYGKHERSAKQIEYVTNLGLKYNLLTQYTSFLAVDNEVRAPKPVQSNNNDNFYLGLATTPSSPESISAPDFQLTEDASRLEEVVVVGYGTIRKESLTSSIGHVSGSDVSSSSITEVLQGRVAGLDVSQTAGEPGDASRIRIRGASSIMDNSSPLVILDGAPVAYESLSQMNANDIESITVLKDASATAVYGSRAANGVLVVSSKKPTYGRRMISFSSSAAIEKTNSLPDLQRQFDIFKTGYSLKNHLTISQRHDKYYYSLKVGNNTQHGFIPKSKFGENSFALKLGGQRSNRLNFDIDASYKNTRGKRLQRGYNMSSITQGIYIPSASGTVDNPNWTIDNNPYSDEANRFMGTIKLNYKLLDYLYLDYQLSGDYLSAEAKTALNVGSVYNPSGHTMNRDEKFKSLNSRFSVKFNKEWDKLKTNVMVGHEYSKSKRDITRLDGYGLQQPGEYNVQLADSVAIYNQSFNRYSNAAFGKMELSYDYKFVLEAGMRGEWSSISDKTLLSPSLSVAMNLHEIFEWRGDLFNYAKLYANISRADRESPLFLDPVYFNSSVYNLNDASNHFESREVLLDHLKPETIRHYEVGANVALWNNRINLSAAWYWKRGKDQLLPTQVSETSVKLENGGRFKTHGFEADVRARLINNRNFSWETGFIFSRERNRVTHLEGRTLMLAGIEGVAGSYAIEGQPLGVLYGTTSPNGEQKILGNPNPDWKLNWSNSLRYRDFTLSTLFEYKKGGDRWNGTRQFVNGNEFSEDGIEDASFIKLREVSLGYYLPLRLFGERSRLRLSIFAANLLLLNKYKGVDPETNLTGSSNGFGLDYFNIPGSQSFGVSLNWEF